MLWLEITLVSYYNKRDFIRSLEDNGLTLWEFIGDVMTY